MLTDANPHGRQASRRLHVLSLRRIAQIVVCGAPAMVVDQLRCTILDYWAFLGFEADLDL